MAPRRRLSVGVGHDELGVDRLLEPSPPQSGQAPNGLLNENSRGSISEMVKPDTGQANLEEKATRLGWPLSSVSAAYSAMAMPSASSSAVSKLSDRRARMSSRTAMRSTTTSMSCFSFLSSTGASAIS